jgi:hypothetical protein
VIAAWARFQNYSDRSRGRDLARPLRRRQLENLLDDARSSAGVNQDSKAVAEWNAVVDSFRRENAGTRTLLPGFTLERPYELMPRPMLMASLGWVKYGRLFDAGYQIASSFVAVSAVGFDAKKTRAMMYMEHRCGYSCAGGTSQFLEKRDGRWVAVAMICSWVT